MVEQIRNREQVQPIELPQHAARQFTPRGSKDDNPWIGTGVSLDGEQNLQGPRWLERPDKVETLPAWPLTARPEPKDLRADAFNRRAVEVRALPQQATDLGEADPIASEREWADPLQARLLDVGCEPRAAPVWMEDYAVRVPEVRVACEKSRLFEVENDSRVEAD